MIALQKLCIVMLNRIQTSSVFSVFFMVCSEKSNCFFLNESRCPLVSWHIYRQGDELAGHSPCQDFYFIKLNCTSSITPFFHFLPLRVNAHPIKSNAKAKIKCSPNLLKGDDIFALEFTRCE